MLIEALLHKGLRPGILQHDVEPGQHGGGVFVLRILGQMLGIQAEQIGDAPGLLIKLHQRPQRCLRPRIKVQRRPPSHGGFFKTLSGLSWKAAHG